MGTFTHPIMLRSAGGTVVEQAEALVDNGAMFTALPASILQRLGVQPLRRIHLRSANGSAEQCDLGEVRGELNGVAETIICLFSDEDRPIVIGRHTLEGFLVAADPAEQSLRPMVGWA